MGRRCTICDHPRRAEIDKALVLNEVGYRTVARQFAISGSALFRHRNKHLPALIAKGLEMVRDGEIGDLSDTDSDSCAMELAQKHQAIEAENENQAIDIVQQLKAINAACLEVLRQARADGQHFMLLRAVDRIAKQIEIQAKLLGSIQESPTINVAILPEWRGIRQVIAEALRPYPEARIAVVEALRRAGF